METLLRSPLPMEGIPPIRRILGAGLFAVGHAVHVPGRVLWCNFDLLRQYGFDVPPSNRMTDRLHGQLVRAFSLRMHGEDEGDAGKAIRVFADRYGGEGIGGHGGSARGAFHPGADLFIKASGAHRCSSTIRSIRITPTAPYTCGTGFMSPR
jgi:hypothetical protein